MMSNCIYCGKKGKLVQKKVPYGVEWFCDNDDFCYDLFKQNMLEELGDELF